MQTSDKATPSHEVNRVSRSQSGARFQLQSDKGNAFARSKKCVSAPRLAHVLRFDECKGNHFFQNTCHFFQYLYLIFIITKKFATQVSFLESFY